MSYHDRGMIKWQPFDSLGNTAKIKRQAALQKQFVRMPSLSSDQLEEMQESLLEAYANQEVVQITYFRGGTIQKAIGRIMLIHEKERFLLLNNHLKLAFSQLLRIEQA